MSVRKKARRQCGCDASVHCAVELDGREVCARTGVVLGEVVTNDVNGMLLENEETIDATEAALKESAKLKRAKDRELHSTVISTVRFLLPKCKTEDQDAYAEEMSRLYALYSQYEHVGAQAFTMGFLTLLAEEGGYHYGGICIGKFDAFLKKKLPPPSTLEGGHELKRTNIQNGTNAIRNALDHFLFKGVKNKKKFQSREGLAKTLPKEFFVVPHKLIKRNNAARKLTTSSQTRRVAFRDHDQDHDQESPEQCPPNPLLYRTPIGRMKTKTKKEPLHEAATSLLVYTEDTFQQFLPTSVLFATALAASI